MLDRSLNSKTVSINGTLLTLQSQTIGVKHRHAGFVWNRPLAIVTERDGVVTKTPIIDVTRIVTIFLFGVTLVFSIFQIATVRRRRASRNE